MAAAEAGAMSRPPRGLTRVYWACHFLRWLPLGLLMPVMALLPAERGLGLAEIGLVFGVYAVVAAVLELPTGNLADIVGRKPVLIAAALFEAACYGGYLVADDAALFAVALALGGIGRALASGALEAWYVDQVYANAPHADIRPAIGGAMFLTNAAVLTGALTAAGLPQLPTTATSWTDSVTALPVAAALLCNVGYLATLATTVRESRSHTGARAALHDLKRYPRMMRDVLHIAGSAGRVRLLLTAGGAVGVGIGTVEAFWQPQLARMLTNPQQATTMFGLLVAASTIIGGCGSLIAAALPARLARRSDLICAGLIASLGAAIILLAAAQTFALAVAALLAVYFFLELRAPLAQTLLHTATPPGQRASVLSAYSMSTNLGAAVATIGLGALATKWGVPAVWTVAALTTIAGAASYAKLARFPTALKVPI